MTAKAPAKTQVQVFGLKPGHVIARKYRVVSCLGSGYEGEVYKIVEVRSGIERAAKLLLPQRNVGHRRSVIYAKKLHKLRHCPILIQYHAEETIQFRREPVTVLISDFVEGEMLPEFLKRFPKTRLRTFEALHLLHALAVGLEPIHLINEYHGDVHLENVIVLRFGLGFDIKILDPYSWEGTLAENRKSDIINAIHVFYQVLGGAKHYSRQPQVVKEICCGLKQSLMLKRFKTMSQLRGFLEMISW